MPKRVPEQDLQAVLATVASFPEGASVDEIRLALPQEVPHRTLQRRLALLVKQKKLIVHGRGRASRYRLPTIVEGRGVAAGYAIVEGRGELRIPLSPGGEAIDKIVREPLQNRRPAGSNREFLDAYRPNETYYLSAETRQQLLNLGRSSAPVSVRRELTRGRSSIGC